jgi:nicotinamide riboside transporter PnuC
MQYFGIDWLATVCGLTGIYLIGSKNRYGFLIMMVASLSWLTVGFLIDSVALVIGSAVFFGLHVRGWRNWGKQPTEFLEYETRDISN